MKLHHGSHYTLIFIIIIIIQYFIIVSVSRVERVFYYIILVIFYIRYIDDFARSTTSRSEIVKNYNSPLENQLHIGIIIL